MPFSKEVWPLVCRPDHSGWVSALWQRALLKESGFIYCGKAEAMIHDVNEDLKPDLYIEDVGAEDEIMAIWYPISGLVEYVEEHG
jgi:hypothetical protein